VPFVKLAYQYELIRTPMQNSTHSTQTSFQQQGYLILRSLLSSSQCVFLYNYALKKSSIGRMDDQQAPGSPSIYGDPIMEMLLEELQPSIETASCLQLFPTYSYFRLYQNGVILKKHTDRPSCEISLTLTLGTDCQDISWPIFVENSQGSKSIQLQPGDGLLYRGCEIPHWREAFAGKSQAQVFLHYVDQNGPYAEWMFDKRKHLNFRQGFNLSKFLHSETR
jgi:hypothetical protein